MSRRADLAGRGAFRYAHIPWLWSIRIGDGFVEVVSTWEELRALEPWARSLEDDPLTEPPPSLPVAEHNGDEPYRLRRWTAAAWELAEKVRKARSDRQGKKS